ncbi:MAG TPA: hypothetical protein VFU29_10940 [Chitinophagaceae bacterium]|nr:hypothetical protein [Chitinophagaceae bacterium]
MKIIVIFRESLRHRRKKWAEYILEFLILFLAVFLGFLAENAREHMVERKKERSLIHLLKKDLASDTAALRSLIKVVMPSVNNLADSTVQLMNSSSIKGNEQNIIATWMNATNWTNFTPNERALSQFKYGGRFDLIEHENVKDEILKYIQLINFYNNYQSGMIPAEHSVDTLQSALLIIHDIQVLTKIFYKKIIVDSLLMPDDIPFGMKFRTYDPAEFKRIARRIEQINYLQNDMLGQYERLYNEAVKVIAILDKEYPDIKI